MAISFVSASGSAQYSGSNYVQTITKPAGIQAGDLIVIMCQSTGDITNATVDGFTKHPESMTSGLGSAIFSKIATASEPASYTGRTPNSSTGFGHVGCAVYRDAKIVKQGVSTVASFTVTLSEIEQDWYLVQQVRGDYPSPSNSFTEIADHTYPASTHHKKFTNVISGASSGNGNSPEYGIGWFALATANQPPTVPTGLAVPQTALYKGNTMPITYQHNDPDGDTQAKTQARWRKVIV